MHNFLFGVYPYIALTVLVVGSIARYERDPFTWKSSSSQLLRRKQLIAGSILFHVGVLTIFAGHFVGLLTPIALFDALGISHGAKQTLAIVAGGIAGSPLYPSHMNGLPSACATKRSGFGASNASSTTFMAPVRSSVAPVRISRITLCGPRMSELPAGMQGGNTHAEVPVFCIFETGSPDHVQERFLIRKIADRLHEIFVTFLIPYDHLAHVGDHVETV